MSNSIKSWAPDDRPREKLKNKGRQALSDAEILAILLRSGSQKSSALDVAKTMLKSYRNIDNLSKANVQDLKQFEGIGDTKAVSIIAALELGRRKSLNREKRVQIKSSEDVDLLMRPVFADLTQEECHLILLSQANQVLGTECIGRGGMNAAIVDGKIVFRHALQYKAVAFILCHNHPSGNLKPSRADINLTERLKEFGNMIDLKLLDHLIFTDSGYYSFADEGDIF